jgi:hypothetical protein
VGVLGAAARSCETDTMRPPTEIEPLRDRIEVLGAIVYVNVPLPLPDVDDSVIQDVVVVAVHVHPAAAVTVTCPVAPLPGTLSVAGVTV